MTYLIATFSQNCFTHSFSCCDPLCSIILESNSFTQLSVLGPSEPGSKNFVLASKTWTGIFFFLLIKSATGTFC